MVHRAPDSRLLANLIQHEKEHVKHLTALFPLSHAALAALSAYAAASNTVTPIIDVLASADDVLHRYTLAIDAWRDQLVALKALEDDLVAVLRDRDILVTRLIKASKSTHRSSRLIAPLPTLGSASLSSLPSTNSLSGHSPASTNPKLAEAQAELQACEAHLTAKEHELDARRITLARDGLGARCRALIDCGRAWSEMGKQGLSLLQALAPDGEGNLSAPKPASSRLSNPLTYASDTSSVTPSQSASQSATRSIETSHEGPSSKAQPRPARASDDLTIVLPPAHAIPELALPTGVPVQPPPPDNDNSIDAATDPSLVSSRKRAKRTRRPVSQHITEASDEDAPSSLPKRSTSQHMPFTPFPNTNDTSSDDEHPMAPLQVVENDPFDVIRKSILAPPATFASSLLPGTAPTARASAPDVRASASYDVAPSKIMFPASASGHGQRGIGLGSPTITQSSPKRQRRTSVLFFGSLRGLFRKPKERGRVGTDWDDAHSSPSPSSPNLARAKSGGWVTRTDARIKSRTGEDSDGEAMSTGMERRKTTTATTTKINGTNVARNASRARLRKGRPNVSTRDNASAITPSHRTGVDGWITDNPGSAGAVSGPVADAAMGTSASTGTNRSRTRRGTMKRKRLSVADLRGEDQGHTDGEVDGARQTLQRVSSTAKGKASEAFVAEPIERHVVAATNPGSTADPNTSVGLGIQPRHATTTATSNRIQSGAPPAHRRSASMSYVDVQMATVVTSTSTGGGTSWRKPPPQIEPQSQQASFSQVQPSQESQPKPNARRHLGNGHAKHAHNQSLMSIVADVTRKSRDEDRAFVTDKARSLDIPRAPGSVLPEWGRGNAQRGEVNEGGHGRTSEDAQDIDRRVQGQVKMPLRSALRNASRTPSPVPVTVPAIVSAGQAERGEEEVERKRGPASGTISPPLRDSASMSSYETGRESFDGEPSSPLQFQSRSPVVRSQSQPPATRRVQSPVFINNDDVRPSTHSRTPSPPPFTFPPPPVSPPPARQSNMHSNSNSVSTLNGNHGSGNGNDPPSSSVSTETAPARRKSVRVSLQPTFSPAPPVLHDEDGDDDKDGNSDRHVPWDGRRPSKTVRTSTGDIWADSSEEDEVYKRARRLLSLVGRGKT